MNAFAVDIARRRLLAPRHRAPTLPAPFERPSQTWDPTPPAHPPAGTIFAYGQVRTMEGAALCPAAPPHHPFHFSLGADTVARSFVLTGHRTALTAPVCQTGTGKTHTMEGQLQPKEEQGIIPNAFDQARPGIESPTPKRSSPTAPPDAAPRNASLRPLLAARSSRTSRSSGTTRTSSSAPRTSRSTTRTCALALIPRHSAPQRITAHHCRSPPGPCTPPSEL